MKKIISLCISALLFIITPCTCFAEEETKNYVQCTLLMEASTGTVISEENGYKRVPQGTLNKLMTVLLTAEEIECGKMSVDTKLTASANANQQQGAVVWLMQGETITVDELLKAVIFYRL